MPWIYRNYYRPARRYWFRRRRFRKPFWKPRRRRYRVRKQFKLSKIPLQQWQPPFIKTCHIIGLTNLIYFNQGRIPFNSVMYENSIIPPGYPACGGFSVVKFNLDNLYSLFQKCTNWWTASNDNLPLCRYMGCKLTLYKSKHIDYVVKYDTTWPGTSNKLTYPSCQPSMILMSKDKIVVPSIDTNPRGKPYKKVYIRPPSQLMTQWYFQKEICKKTLLTLHTSAVSLQKYYCDPDWDNFNITIQHLNTKVITNSNFKMPYWPYSIRGTIRQYLYKNTNPQQEISQLQLQFLVPLTNIQYYTTGDSYHDAYKGQTNHWQQYVQELHKWTGNPLVYQNLTEEREEYYTTTADPVSLFTVTSASPTMKVTDALAKVPGSHSIQKFNEPIILQSRYNPNKDTGSTTKMYLTNVTKDGNEWQPPTNPDNILDGFPLWINIYGFTDFQKKLMDKNLIDQTHILCFQNSTTDPKRDSPIVPIDNDYLAGKSPYQSSVHPNDYKNWYPQLQYQGEQINNIAKCGLGTPKLPDKTSEQVRIKYDFKFKWGGAPPKMITVENPITQPVYPTANTEYETPSLQNPAQAFETMLYSFDQRDHHLTQSAIDRIKKDWTFTETFMPFTEPTREVPATYTQVPQTTETSEKEKETLQQQLQLHRQQQLELRFRISQLMKTMGM
nr:MAG: ORF1 [TTV-like mini virus]UGV36424.1 MAG: ORF1 [TTV-like mini virus]